MEFRNLTPFAALCYLAEDARAERWRVVAIKVGYRLVREGQGRQWQAIVMDDKPEPLCLADEHWGESATTSIRQESDLAPIKPRCDVLLRGSSHAPGGKPAQQWQARLRLSVSTPAGSVDPEPERPRPLNPFMGLTNGQLAQWERAKAAHRQRLAARPPSPDKLLLDKTLRISGPSQFRRLPLLGWRRGTVEPALSVALRWEHSLGGSCRVDASPTKAASTASPPAPLLNEACYSNPLGCGWLEQRWERALTQARQPLPKTLPAPQIEVAESPPLAAPLRCKHPDGELDARGMRDVAARYAHHPAGFAALGRAWAPRLALAGRYDQQWLDEQHPLPPKDFDDGYWNAAPADQQLASWPGDDGQPVAVRLELTNLCAPTLAPDGTVRVELPPHQAFVLARLHDGRVLPLQMQTDTVLIDTEAMTVSLTHRLRVPAELPIRVLEARFECDPAAPLLQWDEGDESTPDADPLNTVAEPA